MKQVSGIFLPDAEAHMPQYLEASGGAYQPRQLHRSLEFVTSWDLAIDIGAHVGLWSKALLERFKRVIAFEPMGELRACLELNVRSERLDVVPIALGAKPGAVSFEYDASHTGMTHVSPTRRGLIPVGRLDDFRLSGVGYIKIDTEGFELQVLEGARATLLENQPVIIVEEKFHGVRHYGQKPYAAIEYLESLGARVLDRVIDDFIVGWADTPGKVRTAARRPAAQELADAASRHQAGDAAGARLQYRGLALDHPSWPDPAHLLSICELQLGNSAAAVEWSERAAMLAPHEPRYLNTLGTALWVAGRTEEACTLFRRLVAEHPQFCEAHVNLGEASAARGQHRDALQHYEQALRLKPDSIQLLTKVGRIHAAHGSTKQASVLFQRALALNPRSQEVRDELAKLGS